MSTSIPKTAVPIKEGEFSSLDIKILLEDLRSQIKSLEDIRTPIEGMPSGNCQNGMRRTGSLGQISEQTDWILPDSSTLDSQEGSGTTIDRPNHCLDRSHEVVTKDPERIDGGYQRNLASACHNDQSTQHNAHVIGLKDQRSVRNSFSRTVESPEFDLMEIDMSPER